MAIGASGPPQTPIGAPPPESAAGAPRPQALPVDPRNPEDAAMNELIAAAEEERQLQGPLIYRLPRESGGGAGMVAAVMLGGVVGGAIYGAMASSNKQGPAPPEVERRRQILAARRAARSDPRGSQAAHDRAAREVAQMKHRLRSQGGRASRAIVGFTGSLFLSGFVAILAGWMSDSMLIGLLVGGGVMSVCSIALTALLLRAERPGA